MEQTQEEKELVKELRDKVKQIKPKELQKEISKYVAERVINEVLIIRDDSRGKYLELQSGTLGMRELNEMGWLQWQTFFDFDPNSKKRIPVGVR